MVSPEHQQFTFDIVAYLFNFLVTTDTLQAWGTVSRIWPDIIP
jgi:hypothetical protein